jgi:hypothetical protein
MKKVEDLVRDGKSTSFEILRQVPLDELDEAVVVLKRHKPADEVCQGLVTLIATAPLGQFGILSAVYRKHCG